MPVTNSCGAEDLAGALLTQLLGDKQFDFDPVDLTDPAYQIPEDGGLGEVDVEALTTDKLTTKMVDGTGVFDVLMKSMSNHLKAEYEKGRITGAEYTKAYIELTTAVLSTASQFLLQKDQAYWQAITAKAQAQVAQAQIVETRVKIELAKTQLHQVRFEAYAAEATYGLTKLKLSTESVGYCTAKFNLDNILPKQEEMLEAQITLTGAQKELLDEQVEERRAQTLDTRRDGTTVVGVLGKQKALYGQQVISYQRDAEVKVAKIFSDAWITMKTLDEGLLPPTGFTNNSLDTILTGLKANVDLD